MTTIIETKEYVISVRADRRFCAENCPYLVVQREDTGVKRVLAAACYCFSAKTPLDIIPERSLTHEYDMANNVINIRQEQPMNILRSLRCVEAQDREEK